MSLPYVVDGETELDSELFNPWVDHMNGLQNGALPIALAGIAAALDEAGVVATDSPGTTGQSLIRGPYSPKFADMETVIFDHLYARSDTAATNRANLQQLLDRIKPSGSGKQVRMFIPPAFDSGNTVPMMVDKSGSGAWCLTVDSGVVIEGAGRGSALKLSSAQPSSTRMLSISGKERVTVRGISLDGNKDEAIENYEQNHCIFIYESDQVSIEDCELKNATGDGVIFGGTVGTPSSRGSVHRCDIHDNYRNAVTLTQANRIRVTDSDLTAANVATSGAFDMEPFSSSLLHYDILVRGCALTTPDPSGYVATLVGTLSSYPSVGLRFLGNHLAGGILNVIHAQHVVIAGNTGEVQQILCNNWSRDVVINGNALKLTPVDGRGVYMVYTDTFSEWPQRSAITGNTFEMGADGDGIVLRGASSVSVLGNTLLGSEAGAAVLALATRDMADIIVDGNVAHDWERFFQASRSSEFVIRRASITNNTGSGFSHASRGPVDLGTVFEVPIIIDPIVYGNRFGSAASGRQVTTNIATPYVISGNPGDGATWNCYGTPEEAITEVVGAVAVRRDGGSGTTMYVKESGTGNTGWSAV